MRRLLLPPFGVRRAKADAASGVLPPPLSCEIVAADSAGGLALVEQSISQGSPFAVAFVDVIGATSSSELEAAKGLLQADPDLQVVVCSHASGNVHPGLVEAFGDTDRILLLKKPFAPLEARQLTFTLVRKWLSTRTLSLQLDEFEKLAELRAQKLSETLARVTRLSEEVIEQEQRLHHLCTHDALTGLPNRSVMLGRIQLAIDNHRSHSSYWVAILIDLYRFKQVVDLYGPEVGDAALIETCLRIQSELRQFDVLGRVGLDEFLILLEQVESTTDIHALADRLHQLSEQAYYIEGHEIYIDFVIGITLGNQGIGTSEQVLRDANIAMKRANEQGKGRTEVLHNLDRMAAVRRLRIERELGVAVKREEFVLHYQPIRDLTTGETAGFEALVRWQHPERGLLPPVEFIEVAEETRHIVPLGGLVLVEACRQLAVINRTYPDVPRFMSINVSAHQLAKPEFVRSMAAAIEDSRVDPKLIKLELTETAMMETMTSLVSRLETLRDLGVSLCIDDFGTGYSSLALLLRAPAKTLKIDRSFVSDLFTSSTAETLISAVVSVGQSLDMDVVAEGIETSEQLEELRKLGCQYGQGYLFSKPLSFERLLVYLEEEGASMPDAAPVSKI